MTPTSFVSPKKRWSRGFRRSQLTATTRLPEWASATARFAVVVVLPSPMLGLAIEIILRSLVRAMNSTFVRSVRYASAGAVFGASTRDELGRVPLPVLHVGTIASTGRAGCVLQVLAAEEPVIEPLADEDDGEPERQPREECQREVTEPVGRIRR